MCVLFLLLSFPFFNAVFRRTLGINTYKIYAPYIHIYIYKILGEYINILPVFLSFHFIKLSFEEQVFFILKKFKSLIFSGSSFWVLLEESLLTYRLRFFSSDFFYMSTCFNLRFALLTYFRLILMYIMDPAVCSQVEFVTSYICFCLMISPFSKDMCYVHHSTSRINSQ